MIYGNTSFPKLITKVGKVGGDFGGDNFTLGYSFKLTIKVQEKYKELVCVHVYTHTLYLDSPAVYILLPLLNRSVYIIITIIIICAFF